MIACPGPSGIAARHQQRLQLAGRRGLLLAPMRGRVPRRESCRGHASPRQRLKRGIPLQPRCGVRRRSRGGAQMPEHLHGVLYTAMAVVEGGREGHGRSLDSRPNADLSAPESMGGSGGPRSTPRSCSRSVMRLAFSPRCCRSRPAGDWTHPGPGSPPWLALAGGRRDGPRTLALSLLPGHPRKHGRRALRGRGAAAHRGEAGVWHYPC